MRKTEKNCSSETLAAKCVLPKINVQKVFI